MIKGNTAMNVSSNLFMSYINSEENRNLASNFPLFDF